MQYQIFIKSQPVNSALEKTFFSCKIKTKSVLNIKAATKPVLQKQPFTQQTINKQNTRRSPLPLKQQIYHLTLYWKWVPASHRKFPGIPKINEHSRKSLRMATSKNTIYDKDQNIIYRICSCLQIKTLF